MLRTGWTYFPILLFTLCTFAGDSDRAGVHFGASISPGLSYALVMASMPESHNEFTSTLGTLGTGIQLAFSKYGKNINSIKADFSWCYPTAWFLGYVSAGYSFFRYVNAIAPSPAFGVEINSSYRINGFNEHSFIPATQIGVKTGYEIKKHITCWIGYLLGFEYYRYSINKTYIYYYDLANIVQFSGTVKVNEVVLANRFQIILSYSFY
jgi:hypothetical protein